MHVTLPSFSIRTRFLAGILLVAVPALATLAVLEDQYVTQLMTTVGVSQFSNDVLDAADDMQDVATGARHHLRTLADLEAPFAGTPQEAARVSAAFAASLTAEGAFSELARLDASGAVITHAHSASATPTAIFDRPVDLTAFDLDALADRSEGVAARTAAVAAAGTTGNHSLLLLTRFGHDGYLAAVLDPAVLYRSFSAAALSGGRVLFLVDAQGNPVAFADATRHGDIGAPAPRALPYPPALRARILRGDTGLIDRGYPEIVSFTSLDADGSGDLPPWIVGESMPRAALLSNITEMRRHTLIVGVITTLVALLFAFLFARQITQPIQSLRRGAERIAAGELDHPLTVRSSDEIGELARSFAAMTASLRATLDELREERHLLEHRVDERTAQLRRQGEELERAYDQLRSVDALKSRFISNASHELRTPLTMLRGAVELLAMHREAGAPPELLQIAVDGVEQLSAIVQTILAYTDVESNAAEWAMDRVDPAAVARLVYDSHAGAAAAKQQSFALTAAEDVPGVWASAEKLGAALSNLVANAITYSPPGGTVAIDVASFTDDDGCLWVELAVQDTGPGVSEDDVPRLLECFEQGGEILTSKPQGVGMGLPVARRIAEHLGGGLRVRSVVGSGSTFALAIPAIVESAYDSDRAAA